MSLLICSVGVAASWQTVNCAYSGVLIVTKVA
jgi:hypothetical protein